MSRLRLSLGENAQGFLKEALAKAIAAQETPEEWRFAILNLVQAVELALKERLKREHPALIYRNVDNRSRTVSTHLAVKRLQDIADLSFGRADLAALQTAVSWRNDTVHYEVDYSITQIKVGVATVLGFLADFYRNHLDTLLDDVLPETLWTEVVALQEFRCDLRRRAEARLAEEGVAELNREWCRRCGLQAFVFGPTSDECYVCGYRPDLIECFICGELVFPEDCEELETAVDRVESACLDCLRRDELAAFHVDLLRGK